MTDRKLANRIAGVDPGLNVTGYAVIDTDFSQVQLVEAGVIRSNRSLPLEQRLEQIYSGLEDVIQSFGPDCLSLEEVFSHYERPRTAILMGHARGVIVLCAGKNQIPVHHYAATQIKSILTGNGRAPKSQVQSTVMQHLDLKEIPTPNDVADAMAIGLCHAFLGRNELSRL